MSDKYYTDTIAAASYSGLASPPAKREVCDYTSCVRSGRVAKVKYEVWKYRDMMV